VAYEEDTFAASRVSRKINHTTELLSVDMTVDVSSMKTIEQNNSIDATPEWLLQNA
jgi:hypothetical protein